MPNLTVSAKQQELLQQALADAVYYRDPPAKCEACEALNDEAKLCGECAELLARSSSYLDLGNELGMTIAA
jgi:hypothetical protein